MIAGNNNMQPPAPTRFPRQTYLVFTAGGIFISSPHLVHKIFKSLGIRSTATNS